MTTPPSVPSPADVPTTEVVKPFRILSLDGGGSKGMFTIGALTEVEAILKSPLSNHFDLIYGTSTGAIIAALIALGKSMAEVDALYKELIPKIMGKWFKWGKTKALKALLQEYFGDKKFDAFVLPIGIVATRCDKQRPMIFKSRVTQALTRQATFAPGFGCTIVEALLSSSAAYPYFKKSEVKPSNEGGGTVETIDGGFVANNPSLYALIDAKKSFAIEESRIRILSVGVGEYHPKKPGWIMWLLNFLTIKSVMETALTGNVNSLEIIFNQLHPNVHCVRLNRPCKVAADLLEKNPAILQRLFLEGRETLGIDDNEAKVRKFFA